MNSRLACAVVVAVLLAALGGGSALAEENPARDAATDTAKAAPDEDFCPSPSMVKRCDRSKRRGCMAFSLSFDLENPDYDTLVILKSTNGKITKTKLLGKAGIFNKKKTKLCITFTRLPRKLTYDLYLQSPGTDPYALFADYKIED
jgi:hypothetical protein